MHISFHEISERYEKDPERLLTRRATANLLGLKPQTLAVWACKRDNQLPFRKVGSRAMYRLGDIINFIENS